MSQARHEFDGSLIFSLLYVGVNIVNVVHVKAAIG